MLRSIAVVFALALAAPAASAAVVGRLDVANGTAAVGWACLEGVSAAKIPVRIEVREPGTDWRAAATLLADAERGDVAASGTCGTDAESRWHGFEHTVWPDDLLARGAAFDVRAVALDGTAAHVLPGEFAIALAPRGFPAAGTWRTDYDDPARREPTLLGCVFPFKGANRRGNGDFDPFLMSAGATVTVPWVRHPEYGETDPDWCVSGDGAFAAWSASNAATNAPSWPARGFWVVSANSERAYSRTQSGPPSQSEAINAHGVYGVAAVPGGYELAIENRAPYTDDDFPYLSVGTEIDRGAPGLVATVAATGPDTLLELDVTQLAQTDAIDPYGRAHYHDVHVFVVAMWGGYKRLAYVSLATSAVGVRRWWNWNAFESFWFPGGEIGFLGHADLARCSGFADARVPALSGATVGATLRVSLPLRALFDCIAHEQPGLGWSAPRDTGLALAISGVHFGIEQADYQAGASMSVRFAGATLARRTLLADGME